MTTPKIINVKISDRIQKILDNISVQERTHEQLKNMYNNISSSKDINDCEIATGKKCKKFARKRTIKWKNGINPGKGKMSRIDSKIDFEGLKAKLTELGFYGNWPN